MVYETVTALYWGGWGLVLLATPFAPPFAAVGATSSEHVSRYVEGVAGALKGLALFGFVFSYAFDPVDPPIFWGLLAAGLAWYLVVGRSADRIAGWARGASAPEARDREAALTVWPLIGIVAGISFAGAAQLMRGAMN